VAVLGCGGFGIWRFWYVAVLVCGGFGRVAVLVLWRFESDTKYIGTFNTASGAEYHSRDSQCLIESRQGRC